MDHSQVSCSIEKNTLFFFEIKKNLKILFFSQNNVMPMNHVILLLHFDTMRNKYSLSV